MNNKYFKALALFVSITLFFYEEAFAEKTINITEQVNEVQFLPVNGTAIPTNDILNDTVNIAFGKIRRENIVGSVSFINSEPILKNDNVQFTSDAMLARIPGLLGFSSIRGIGNTLFIVDGLPRDISTINFAEVEQVTVLKDINSSVLYGSAAVNGVVQITTKRGNVRKKQINVTGYYGISTPSILPNYLSSADYMTLYNEARQNDGLSKLYDDELIAKYRSGSNLYMYPNVDYYSREYLRSFKPFFKTMAEFSGGNNVATYYSNVGWEQIGSILNFGEGKKNQMNRFNIRGNVDLKVNSFITGAIDAVAVITNEKGSISDYWAGAATLKPNLFTPLLPIENISRELRETLLSSRRNDVDGKYILGGTQNYLTNPIADTYFGGENVNVQNYLSFNNRIKVDLNKVLEGLSFHTNFSFDYLSLYDQYIENTYAVYEAKKWEGDTIVELSKYGNDTKPGVQKIRDASYQRKIGFYGMFDYKRTLNERHQLSASLLGMGNLYKVAEDYQSNKNSNLGLRLNYIYNQKYIFDFSSAYTHSVKLAEGSRNAFSPTFGFAWLISSEDFITPLNSIDYLKIKLTGGIINSDAGINGFYFHINPYEYSGSYSWQEKAWMQQGVRSLYGSNKNLGFEKRKDLNLGIEGLFFNRILGLEANVFYSYYSDQVTFFKAMFPSFYSNFVPYVNFGENAYRGAEVGLSFNHKYKDWEIALGANALYTTSEVKKKNEIYANDYQYRKGHPVDAIFGLEAEGFFTDENDISNRAFQAFGTVKPGDIKYVDQNNDGVVNEDDEVPIGRAQAPFSYGLNLLLSYKNISLFTIGNGQLGADSYINGSYYRTDGDKKYSDYLLGRWTEETKVTATYPRLTTMESTNNYHNSTFWLYKDDYFTLQRVQLTYQFPSKIAESLFMKGLNFYFAASNLLTISKYRDIKELRIGSEPNYRSFSLGMKIIF